MGIVTLYTDPAASYYSFRDDILKRSPESYLYILPLNRAVRYLKRDLIKNFPRDALFDPLIFTFSSLMKQLNKKMPDGKKIITDAMKLVILQDLLNQKTQEFESIHPAKSVKGISNLIRRLNQILTELNHFGYGAESFVEPPQGAESKYHDFGLLMNRIREAFQNELSDETGIFSETISALDENLIKQISSELQCIFISGYGIYTPLMLRFLERVRNWADINISLAYSDKNQDLFRHTQNAYDALKKMADKIKVKDSQTDGLEYILFNQKAAKTVNENDKKRIHIQKTRTMREELSFIACTIKEIHRSKGVPLNRIGVTFPNLEIYASLLRVVFSEYKIPFNLSTGFSLSQSPLIQTFMNCLKIVRDNYIIINVFDLLTSPFIRNQFPSESARLAGILRKGRFLYFSENWRDQVSDLIQRELKTHPEHENIDFSGILDLLTNVLQVLKHLEGKKSPAEFQTDFINCLKELGLLSWYIDSAAPLSRSEQEREFRAFNQFIKLLNQMIWILQYKDSGEKYSLNSFEIYLREILQNAVYNIREWPEYGVQVMPRLEIQSVDLDVLFIGGLIEGVFPRKFVKDIFFNDTERELMGLNASEDLRDQDKFLFYQLLRSTHGPVFLTYPSFTNETRQIRSGFLDNMCDVCGISETEHIPQEQLINERNILIHAGKYIFSKDRHEFIPFLSSVMPANRKYWLDTVSDLYRIFDRSNVTYYEGNLTTSRKVLDHLRNKIPDMTFSVSALESYLFCPMQYFLQRIMHLEPEEEDEDGLSAKEKGILIHYILFRFFSELRTKKSQDKPWKFEDLLTRIAREEFSSLPLKGFLWNLEQENYFGTDANSGLWHSFLQNEKTEIQGNGFIPEYFETAFGLKRNRSGHDEISDRKPFILKQNKRQLKLSGKVDRIDIHPSGWFLVLDYKTGSGRTQMKRSEIESGKNLQLPIYIEAISQNFREKGIKALPAAGSYYFLGDPQKPQRKIVIDENNREDVFSNVTDNVFKIVSNLEKGIFVHTDEPDDHRCSRFCNFARICRKDRSKLLARKNQY